MACFRPLKGWRSKDVNENGKRKIVFNAKQGFLDMPVELPCGQCIGCRLERSRQWAMRCVHEAMEHDANCFITLTYDQENLPKDGSLHLEDFQKFFKRLRKQYGKGIRFFHCGEYGDKNSRPHYHAIIFGLDFKDKKLYSTRDNIKLYTSKSLEKLWGKGFCPIGEANFETAAYVARYITKKVTGNKADEYYNGKKPEYTTMSRRPGIGSNYIKKYSENVYKDDNVVLRGKKMRPPKYYDQQLEKEDKIKYDRIKLRRMIKGEEHEDNNTAKRLEVREKLTGIRLKQLKRGYENET